MKGYLASQGLHLGEHRIGSSLSHVDPQSHDRRQQDAIDRSNPKPYIANYFGHKIHLNQNEKLIHFGVTHVIAVDGYSGMIVSHATMPIKNNLIIYENVYRESILNFLTRLVSHVSF